MPDETQRALAVAEVVQVLVKYEAKDRAAVVEAVCAVMEIPPRVQYTSGLAWNGLNVNC